MILLGCFLIRALNLHLWQNPQRIQQVDPIRGYAAVKLLVVAKPDVPSRDANARFRWGMGHGEY